MLLEDFIVRLDPAAFEAFRAAVDAPAQAVPEMVALLKRPAPWSAE